MSGLVKLLANAIGAESRTSNVGLLLSGGIDSSSVGVALQEAGKSISAYTYELPGYRSEDREKAEMLAHHFGWPLRVIAVPTSHVHFDFIRLCVENGCKRKVQFEVTYPLPYIFGEIEEEEVWSGFNADDHYGNSRKIILDQARLVRDGVPTSERKRLFDLERRNQCAKLENPNSGDTWHYAQAAAQAYSKRLCDPYLHETLFKYFHQFDHKQLSSPAKPVVRAQLAKYLEGAPAFAVGVRFQVGGGVDALFRTLLKDRFVNRFNSTYSSVSALCLRWAREVEANRPRFVCEVASFPDRPRAKWRQSSFGGYAPYTMRDVREASAEARFNVISTFSGGGGSSLGYRLAGGSVIAAIEFVAEAARTYARNFPETRVDSRDIREITGGKYAARSFLASVGLKPQELDILDGSPPCSEFSVAGRGIAEQNVLKPYSDVTQSNIATLPFDFVDLAFLAEPKIVIMENVPALASSRAREVLERVLKALRFRDGERAYYATWSVLSASDFGVAQKRKRLFIVGIRRDVGEATGVASDANVLSLFPTPTHVPSSIRSAFEGLKQSWSDIEPWFRSAVTSSLGRAIRCLPKNPLKLIRPYHVDPDEAGKFTLTRCSWGLPAPTLVVSGQRPDGMTGAIHPDQDRKFTLPELKRLSALPDDFVLTGTLAQAAERVCRMVPPPLTKAIAESVYEQVLVPYREKTNGRP